MIEVVIDSIRVNVVNYQRLVLLKEKAAERFLPIWIGPAESDAIAMKLQGVVISRPMTHDLLRSVIDALGASVDYIVVNDLKNDNFFAKILLRVDGHQIEVDSRPSDALALAVRVEVPIYVDESVMDKAGVLMDKETGKSLFEGGEGFAKEGKKISEEELKNLGAFKDVIDNIDWDDFEKRKS
ncbi:MAG: hypothetical protein A2Z28_05460 [Chloroflexi bacterium RBG_16_51_9]|nr:MAG: hypothetical protein A2Z28_05460 [Chloroflexi bacterium RBG_16_51_9]